MKLKEKFERAMSRTAEATHGKLTAVSSYSSNDGGGPMWLGYFVDQATPTKLRVSLLYADHVELVKAMEEIAPLEEWELYGVQEG